MKYNITPHSNHSVRATFLVFLTLLLSIGWATSCQKKGKQYDPPVDNRNLVPSLHSTDVSTLVSDSGVIRYRIQSKDWLIYDKVDTPYWDFPYGLSFERFTTDFLVDAQIKCLKATYYYKEKLWHLQDSVEAMNLKGEHFKSQELFWDENKEIIYSDSLITITQEGRIIIGKGFHSNQNFTKYSINNPTGIFPIKTEEKKQDTIKDIDTTRFKQPHLNFYDSINYE